MRTVDAYLSRKVQPPWPSAVVYKTSDGRFVMERGNGVDDLDLGGKFSEAKAAVDVIIRAEAARRTEKYAE